MSGSGGPRVLLVGAGAMGSHHGRVIAQSPRCELAGIVDPAQDRGRALAERFGAAWRPEIGSLSGMDAVVVASSTDQHRLIALKVLAEGIPLFVEKPLCASLAGSRELVEAALRRDVPLMCGFVERFNPAALQALSLVEHPRSVRTRRLSGYSPRMHAGVTWDLLVHDVDLALRIFDGGVPKVVNATVTRCGGEERIGEDTVVAEMEFPDGGTAALTASRVSFRRERRLTIVDGTKVIVADLLNPSVAVHSRAAARRHRSDSEGREPLAWVDCTGFREPLMAQWDRFVDILEGRTEASAETHTILPSHEAVAAVLNSAEGLCPDDELVSS